MNKIKAVIFDMDGVLIDSEPLWKIAEAKVFKSIGLNISAHEMEKTVGLRIDEVVDYWFLKYPWTNKSQETVVEEIITEMVLLISSEGKALVGVLEILKFLKQENIKIGLATSSYTVLLETVLKTLNISNFFDITMSAQNVTYGKPHPQVYIETAERLKVSPENCLVVEDSYNGMLAGLSAKMTVAVIPEKSHTANPKLKLAHYIFDDLLELKKYLETKKDHHLK